MKRLLRNLVIIFAFGISPTIIQAQLQTTRDFSGIRCSGPVPTDIRKSLEQLYMEDKQRVRDYNNGKLPNRDKIFSASYYINQLTASGRILYGDPVTQMLEKIVDTLLTDYPELRKELRVYTVKSTEVNAFATGQGMLFVNLGLVAQVEDEAQLAFVLSHEIVHYVRKHNAEILSRRKHQRDTTGALLNDFLRYHCRSREMESEADSLGIEMFYRNSPYNKRVAEGFFDVLQYGYLPFDEIVFDTTQFNSPYFKPSKGSFLTKVNPISAREDYNDSASTHPNLLKRRLAATALLSNSQGGEKYVVTTKKSFDDIRTLARMECIRIDILLAEYASAYYNCYVLLRQQPENKYLQFARLQALYGAAKFRNYSAAANITDSRDKEGEVQQAYHFMRRCKQNELCIIAIRELWKSHLDDPSDEKIVQMAGDLIMDLRQRNNFNAESFASRYDTTYKDVSDSTSSNPKYSNVRRRRRQQENIDTYRFAFTDLIERDRSFESFLKEHMQQSISNQSTESEKDMFVYAPIYYVVNDRSGELNLSKSVRKEEQLVNDLSNIDKALGIGTVDFSDAAMRTHDDEDYYNDFVALNDWTNEFWQVKGNVPMIYSTKPLMDQLMKKYDADKLSLGCVINGEHIKYEKSFYTTMFCLLSVVGIPIFVYNIIANREGTFVQNRVVNTNNGKLVSRERSFNNVRDSRAEVRGQLYAITLNGLNPKKTPGYLGKHLIVSGIGGISFPFFGRLYDRERVDAIALRYGGMLEYAIGKQSSIALTADYGNTTFDVRDYNTAEAGITTASLTYRHYLNDHVAPLGVYGGIGLSASLVNLTPTPPGHMPGYLDKSYKRAGLQIDLGRNSIFFDWLVLNIGLRYNLTIANPFEKFDYEPVKNPIRMMNANLWLYNLVSIHLAIGIIPF